MAAMITVQSLKNKLGEVKFRAQLSRQHLGDKQFFSQEYDSTQMLKVLKEKTARAIFDFSDLKKRQIITSPFLEIGAGYGQAALVLTNKFKSVGYASDIAIEPLTLMNDAAKKLKFTKIPKKIVCDAENLPFENNSFSFIFCYQTLHHFVDPSPILKEIKRILMPGGVFFFAEEPVAQSFNIPLWHRPTKLRWWEKILKFTLILPFISRIGKTEIDHGILEESFPLSLWIKALNQFEKVKAEIKPFPLGPVSQIQKNRVWKYKGFSDLINRLFIFMLGGGISGLVTKQVSQVKKVSSFKLPSLACPNCWYYKNGIKDRLKLKSKAQKLCCSNCKQVHKTNSDVLTILPKKLASKLYPNN